MRSPYTGALTKCKASRAFADVAQQLALRLGHASWKSACDSYHIVVTSSP